MNWIVLAILGLLLTLLALIIVLYNSRRRKRLWILKDTDEFLKELAKWEPLVLEQDGTLRGVKRFANRARFLMTGESSDALPYLVGLIALEEMGCIDPSVNEFKFWEWSKGELWMSIKSNLTQASVSKVETFLQEMRVGHWKHYRALATGSWSQSNGLGW